MSEEESRQNGVEGRSEKRNGDKGRRKEETARGEELRNKEVRDEV